jgi:putative membrane protein
MNHVNRWGIAAGVAAALAVSGVARAQSERSSGAMGSGSATSESSSPTRSMGSSESSSAGQKLDKKELSRLETLHAGNQAEIQMGQLGSQNAQSNEVKSFAQQMQTDHQQMDQDLTQAAQSAGASSLEGKDFQKAQKSAMNDMKKLQGKTGADFDKAYMSQMVKDHQKDLKEIKAAVKDAQKKNPELASALQQGETKVQSHLDQAKQVQESLKKGGASASSASGSSTSGTGSAAPQEQPSGANPHSGSRGDTGGPTPGGADRGSSSSGSSSGSSTGGAGGAAGTSSDQGKR